MDKCWVVKVDDILSAMKRYIVPLFEASTSVAMVGAPPGKLNATAAALVDCGFEVEALNNGDLPEELRCLDSAKQNMNERFGMHRGFAPVLDFENWTDRTRGRVLVTRRKAIDGLRAIRALR